MPVQKTVNREFIFIAILGVLIVAVWTGLTVYQTLRTSTVPKVLQEQLEPINSDFDTQLVNALNLRKAITQQELSRLPPRALSLVAPAAEESLSGTVSAQLLESGTASPAAQTSQ